MLEGWNWASLARNALFFYAWVKRESFAPSLAKDIWFFTDMMLITIAFVALWILPLTGMLQTRDLLRDCRHSLLPAVRWQ